MAGGLGFKGLRVPLRSTGAALACVSKARDYQVLRGNEMNVDLRWRKVNKQNVSG